LKFLKCTILSTLALIFFLIPITASAYPNEPDGFRDLQWGTNLETVKNQMVYETTSVDGKLKYYKKKNENLRLDNIKLEYISYGFSDNRLVRVEAKPLVDVAEMDKACQWIEDTCGVFSSIEYHSGLAFWEGDVTNIAFRIPGEHPCKIVFSSAC